ncbi:MAG: hypothetical protein ACRERC_16705 [Candidatus Binatia bacterium]
MRTSTIRLMALCLALLLAASATAELTPEMTKALADAKYVYISSTRKDGSFGAPAEIWFMAHEGAVYVGTRPTSWRVRRINAGRPKAKIAVGAVDGPSFIATGTVVKNDPAIEVLLMGMFAKKYPDRWPSHAQGFRDGFADGSRVVVKYTPAS